MTNSIFLLSNLTHLNFNSNDTLCVGQDASHREVIEIKKIHYTHAFFNLISLGFFSLTSNEATFFQIIKFVFEIDNFSRSKIREVAKQEYSRLQSQNIDQKLVKKNIQHLNRVFFKAPLQVIERPPSNKKSNNAPFINANSKTLLTFESLIKKATPKRIGQKLKNNELASYSLYLDLEPKNQKLCNQECLYLGLSPNASQYYNAKVGAHGKGQSSPSCTLFAMTFIDTLLFQGNPSDNFNAWIIDFTNQSPKISKHQANILKAVRDKDGLKEKLLTKKLEDASDKIAYQVYSKSCGEENCKKLNRFRHNFLKKNQFPDLMDPKVWEPLSQKQKECIKQIHQTNADIIKNHAPQVHPDEIQALGYLNRPITTEEAIQIANLIKRPIDFQHILTQIKSNITHFLSDVWDEKIPGQQLEERLHSALEPALAFVSLDILNQIKSLICTSYMDQRFSLGDLKNKIYSSIAPKCTKNLSNPQVIPHTEDALKNFTNRLTSSDSTFSYAVVTTPNHKTYSIIYSSKRALAIVFDSHRSCAHITTKKGLFLLLKNIHTEQNLDMGKQFKDPQTPPFGHQSQEIVLNPNAPNYEEQLQMLQLGGENQLPDSTVSSAFFSP